ncbi:MAG TPA: triose-phosphate isomerase [Bacteroidales bacterium]|jgi:triosephosphate isomerase|nr:triose-phosphate isomerase [Bacteroidales bacterium]
MRKHIVAGNWKMNKTFSEGIDLINKIINKSEPLQNVQLIIAPPFILTSEAARLAMNKNIDLAGQNCANHDEGAYTGEISARMLKSSGATYVILGHSERRAYYHETDEIINTKIKLCLENSLTPIVCCGEVLEEREANKHFEVVAKQIKGMFQDISSEAFKNIVIAYEPVWAIGTGKTASPEQAQEMHLFIRETIKNIYGSDLSNNVSILYGGSCKPSNAKELFANPDVDGGLIGGASLNADDFIAIANSF